MSDKPPQRTEFTQMALAIITDHVHNPIKTDPESSELARVVGEGTEPLHIAIGMMNLVIHLLVQMELNGTPVDEVLAMIGANLQLE